MKTLEQLQQEYESARIQYEKTSKALNFHIKNTNNQEIKNCFKNGISVESVMRADYEILNSKYFKQIHNFIRGFPGIYSGGMCHVFKGENSNIKQNSQICLKVMFDQFQPFEKQLGILEFVPYLLPISNFSSRYNGKFCDKFIDIFEYTLSEYANYQIVLRDETWSIINTRGLEKGIYDSKDLREVLKYVYDHMPYKLKE